MAIRPGKKVGPLPLWGWAAVIGGAYLFFGRSRVNVKQQVGTRDRFMPRRGQGL